jgi:signal transduction histidine kinase
VALANQALGDSVAWCSGLALWADHSLITVAPRGLRRSRAIGSAAGLFAANLTGPGHLWHWVPPTRRELDHLEAERGDRGQDLSRVASTRQIAASVAHEVSNPLQSLVALIDLMALEPEEADRRERQIALQNELETIEVIIRRLVDSGDHLKVLRRAVEPEALLDSCIEVSVLPGPRAVTVHVDDSGSGVDPQAPQRLVEPGYSRRPGGTGLGLFLSARVADAHGGALEYGQRPLGGARFSMTLSRTETA